MNPLFTTWHILPFIARKSITDVSYEQHLLYMKNTKKDNGLINKG